MLRRPPPPPLAARLSLAYRMRWKRRRYLFRALRKARQLRPVADRTGAIRPGDVLLFATMRNEASRLPYFLSHYRRLGIAHFLVVDNGSDDATGGMLAEAPDISVWRSDDSYRLSRFGIDWITWLQTRHGHGHWCLTVDADETLIYPRWESCPLPDLAARLEGQGRASFGALMLDMYPRGRLSAEPVAPGDDPFATLGWFDAGPYRHTWQPMWENWWVQGGTRERAFFAADPRRSPTLNKTPFVRWRRGHAYVTSTHALLPRHLNRVWPEDGTDRMTGILLHSKFADSVLAKSAEEKRRRQHFENSALYDAYYDALIADPVLWHEGAAEYRGWRDLVALGLMSEGPERGAGAP